MKYLITLVIVLLEASALFAQVPVTAEQRDPIPTEHDLRIIHVDTMVRHIRNQFYGNNFDLTIELGERTLKEAHELNNLKAIVSISSLMGNAFMKLDDTLQAKRIFSESLAMAEKQHDSTKIIITAQIDLGNFYALQGKGSQAIPIYKKAILPAEKLYDTTHLYILNYNIAELYLDDKNPSDAQPFVLETNKYVEALKPDAYHAGAKLLTGKLYFLQRKNEAAIEILNESIKLSETSGFMDGLIEGHDYLAKSYARIGDHQSAYDQMQLVDSYKAEKYKSDKIEAVEYATAKFKLNQYQQELKAQALQNEVDQQLATRETTFFWIKIALAILFVSSIFLWLSYRKRKQLLVHLVHKNKQYLEAKEKSEELAKAKSILFSNITHELRTPMYGIIGMSSLLMRDTSLGHHKENLSSLKFSANHLLSLINNVLQLTNIYATKKDQLKKNRIKLRSMIDNVVKSSEFINPAHPNTYNILIDKSVPEYVIGDRLKISQVFINLIGNASKFTHDGIITIRIIRKQNRDNKICLYFSVKDSGVGIPAEKQEMLFDEFAQSGTNEAHHGTGLGLPIVKKILDLHDARINLTSVVGQGTEISFELWFEESPMQTTPKTNGTAVLNEKLNGEYILVVDDNKINQLVTRKVLIGYGATVSVAGGGAEAIQMAKDEKFDLILMDINMPEINGFEATRAIRKDDKDIPIIALTAVEIEKVTGENTFSLMNDCIIKPYKNEEFLATIAKHLNITTNLQLS